MPVLELFLTDADPILVETSNLRTIAICKPQAGVVQDMPIPSHSIRTCLGFSFMILNPGNVGRGRSVSAD